MNFAEWMPGEVWEYVRFSRTSSRRQRALLVLSRERYEGERGIGARQIAINVALVLDGRDQGSIIEYARLAGEKWERLA